MHRHRVEHALHRPLAADFARVGRRVAHALEQLEDVPVRAAVLVNRHELAKLSAVTLRRPLAIQRLAVARGVLERRQAGLRRAWAWALAAHGREGRGGAHETADHERADAVGPGLAVHGAIVRLAP